MCGKTVEIFARKCLLLKALHVACTELEGVEGCNAMTTTPEFSHRLENIVNNHDATRFIVTEEISIYALNLTEYLHKSKLLIFILI